jgi:FkbM family methyltransferase
MRFLTGPRMYYSMFGARGLLAGAKCRFFRRPVQVVVRVPFLASPIWLRLRTTDVELCREVLINRLYDCELLRAPSVIVDAGANIGLVSVWYASKYPHAKVISMEPESSNFEMLCKNVETYPNIIPVRAALWNKKATVNLFDPGAGHTAYQTRENTRSARPEDHSIPSMTIGQVMAAFDIGFIDLLKVDIEGAEKEVFESAADWIRHVGVIAIELHDDIRPRSSQPVRAATQDFEITWQEGEITFWAKKDLASKRRSRSENSKATIEILRSETLTTRGF